MSFKALLIAVLAVILPLPAFCQESAAKEEINAFIPKEDDEIWSTLREHGSSPSVINFLRKITDESSEKYLTGSNLNRFYKLEAIFVSENDLSPGGLERLAQLIEIHGLPRLKYLVIRGSSLKKEGEVIRTEVSAKVSEALANAVAERKLYNLEIWSCASSPQALEKLKEGVRYLSSLEFFDLRGSHATFRDIAWIFDAMFGAVLEDNPDSTAHFRNDFGNKGLLSKIKSLDFRDNKFHFSSLNEGLNWRFNLHNIEVANYLKQKEIGIMCDESTYDVVNKMLSTLNWTMGTVIISVFTGSFVFYIWEQLTQQRRQTAQSSSGS